MDTLLVRQVIVNLLENAIRHSGDTEHIFIHGKSSVDGMGLHGQGGLLHRQAEPEYRAAAGNTPCNHRAVCSDLEPKHEMEKVLFAADELTGLIWSAALMRPSKSVMDMEFLPILRKFTPSSHKSDS